MHPIFQKFRNKEFVQSLITHIELPSKYRFCFAGDDDISLKIRFFKQSEYLFPNLKTVFICMKTIFKIFNRRN